MRTFSSAQLLSGLMIFSILFFGAPLSAHPVFYADGWGLMTWNNSKMSELYFARTLSHRFALGVHYFGYREDKGVLPEENYYLGQLSFLVKRWNKPRSQGNIYLSLAPGLGVKKLSEGENKQSFSHYTEIQADWENRRYYVLGKLSHLWPRENNQEWSERLWAVYRAGFAPYLAEFDELNTWIIFEAKQDLIGEANFDISPLIRIFYSNVLTEVGYSLRGNVSFNFMTHF